MADVLERVIAGRPLSIQVTKFAQQADGAVAVQYFSVRAAAIVTGQSSFYNVTHDTKPLLIEWI